MAQQSGKQQLMIGTAAFSPCGQYRYYLSRQVTPDNHRRCAFLMLNPSTADATADDPTIRRCIGFARREGCGWLDVFNLYALVAPDPKALQVAEDPIGPDNLMWLRQLSLCRSEIIIAAFGRLRADAKSWMRQLDVEQYLPLDLRCLGKNRDGSPRHPLYLPGNTPLEPWSSVAYTGPPDLRNYA